MEIKPGDWALYQRRESKLPERKSFERVKVVKLSASNICVEIKNKFGEVIRKWVKPVSLANVREPGNG